MAFTPTNHATDSPPSYDSESSEQRSFFNRMMSLSRPRKFFSRADDHPKTQSAPLPASLAEPHAATERKPSNRIIPLGPGAPQVKRLDSERRERLEPTQPKTPEKRALSVDARRLFGRRRRSPPPTDPAKVSAPTVYGDEDGPSAPADFGVSHIPAPEVDGHATQSSLISVPSQAISDGTFAGESYVSLQPPPSCGGDVDATPSQADYDLPPDESMEDLVDDDVRDELEERWILNLSMHFRDKSPREKFFVTYAETANLWRRITVSVDYRNAPMDSLERDLQSLLYQRDKSARIYESIRSSLADIEFFDTVTNLRLETSDDDRLHVHVTEDVNEIIPYPPVNLLDHVDIPRYSEEEVHFQSHMSGFVYKVQVNGEMLIKKEIPGPDSVEEFLYEINALYNLRETTNVVQFKGLVIDNQLGAVKGILIAFAEKGPLVDLIYDYRGHLTWERRRRWAMEIINGLAEIHETGFVQGDFTLSNIVVDEHDTAIIIDINRRGCPVGWEPPEIATMIASGQRISMYIGVKSDLFQLGMVLWALAEEIDEPERQERPLRPLGDHVPQYYRETVEACLELDPRRRPSAKELLSRFPSVEPESSLAPPWSANDVRSPHSGRSQTEYIDPAAAVGLEDIENHSQDKASPTRTGSVSRRFWSSHTGYESQSSVGSHCERRASCIVPRRGRSPPASPARLATSAFDHRADEPPTPPESSDAPQILAVSPTDERTWEELYGPDGRSFLIGIDENADERQQRLRRSQERIRQTINEAVMQHPSFSHVDSGLGDMGSLSREGTDPDLDRRRIRRANTTGSVTMQHVDSGLADMDLAGIGENESLKEYRKELELDEGPLGRAGRDLVPVNEEEVVDDFGGDQQSTRERIAAVDKAFPGHAESAYDSKASYPDAIVGSSQQQASAAQDGNTSVRDQHRAVRDCTYG